MRQFLAQAAKALVPQFWGTISYSQEGEDLALTKVFGPTRQGFYIDIGSHHPQRFSNSYLFYRRGWRGLCIDPLPGTALLFRRHRQRDLVAELGVSLTPGTLPYHMFNEPALNTFDEQLAREREGLEGYHQIGVRNIKTLPLDMILNDRLPPGQTIDFLSVDVEGLDLQVLQSNDWSRYRPHAVVAEALNVGIQELEFDPIVAYLRSVGYSANAKTGQSIIFLDDGANRGLK